jgi:CRISPR/Cas system-associated endonuclease Cas1
MEPFRPLVVDAALIAACNNGELPPEAFETVQDGCRLNALGRRAALTLFERRLAQAAAEAGTRQRLTYRDALTRQARGLASSLRHGRPFAAFEPAR